MRSQIFHISTVCQHIISGDESYVAGRKYWEVKLDKLPKIEKHLQIGISIGTKIYVFFPLIA